jgi:hypothetical protein
MFRFGSIADISQCNHHVCFTPESGHLTLSPASKTYCWEDQWQAGPWSPRQSFPLFLNLAFYLLHLQKLETLCHDVADAPSSIVITCDVNPRVVGSLWPLYQEA